MRISALLPALLSIAFASGCAASRSSQSPPATPQDLCSTGIQLLGSPYVTPAQAEVLIEKMRNSGCMNAPAPASSPAPKASAEVHPYAATVTKGQACEELALKETYPVAMRDKCKGNLTEECKRLIEGWLTATALKKRQCITEPRGDLK
jgi:hypothetical protein